MATLTSKQLKDSYQGLLTIKTADDANPLSGRLENGLGNAITNLGIGIDSGLTYPLTIKEDTNNSYIHFVNSTTGSLFSDGSQIGVPSGSSDFLINNRESANIRFLTSGDEKLRIEADGDIAFYDNSDNQSLFWDASDARLNLFGSDYQFGIKQGANQAWYHRGVSDGSYRLHLNGTGDVMTLDSSGNVGIGTTSPDGLLNLAHQTSSNSLSDDASGYALTLNFEGATNDYGRHIAIRDAGGDVVSAIGGFDEGTGGATGLYFATGNTTSIAERMRIDSSGNVGIGATNIYADGLSVGSTDDNSFISSGGENHHLTLASVGSGGTLRFFTQGGTNGNRATTESMRIDTSGNVLVGATSLTEIDGTPTETGTGLKPSGTQLHSVDNGGNAVEFRINGTGIVGTINCSGSSTSYNTSSDYRLKENVVPMEGALDKVAQLKPSTFNFIADADTDIDGFIAHEVQEVVPNAVSGGKDAVDEEGNPMYQGIDHSKLVPILVGAIQELKAEIEQLKAK